MEYILEKIFLKRDLILIFSQIFKTILSNKITLEE